MVFPSLKTLVKTLAKNLKSGFKKYGGEFRNRSEGYLCFFAFFCCVLFCCFVSFLCLLFFVFLFFVKNLGANSITEGEGYLCFLLGFLGFVLVLANCKLY